MIEFSGVTKAFNGIQILNELSFTARDGAVTGFIGPNGAGKSTSFKILLGLLAPDSGQARIDGVKYRNHLDPGKSVGAFLGPDTIPDAMTGRGYLTYTADLLGLSRKPINDHLEAVGLAPSATKRIAGYSFGMKQRLGIAAAFLGDATNLILDEPVNGLDIDGVLWLRDSLRDAADSGRCVLLSSHLLSELELVANDVVMLGAGRVSRAGAMSTIRNTENGWVVVVSEDNVQIAQHLRNHGATVEQHHNELRITNQTINWVARTAGLLDVPLVSVTKGQPRLEEIYLEQVRRDETGSMQ